MDVTFPEFQAEFAGEPLMISEPLLISESLSIGEPRQQHRRPVLHLFTDAPHRQPDKDPLPGGSAGVIKEPQAI